MSPPLRVLLASAESHPTHRSDIRVLFGKSLPELGISVDLLALVTSTAPRTPWPGGRLISRPIAPDAPRQIADFLQQCSLFRLCRQYDALIVRDKPVLAIIGYLAARLTGTPFAYWMSFPLPEAYADLARQKEPRRSLIRRATLWSRGVIGNLVLYRWLMHRADWLFVQSDQMVRDLRAKGLKHDRVSPVPMGVDVESIPPPAERPALLAGKKVAVYLGTLDRARNLEVLVDAALIVARTRPDFLMLVIGEADEPSERGWIQQYAESAGAGHLLHFTGKLPFEQGLGLTRLADVGLSPFKRTPLLESASPTKAVEYLAAGIPVICNDQPDQAKVIGESGGGWCVPLTAPAFAQAILECLADPEAAQAKARAGRDWVRAHRSYQLLAEPVARHLRSIARIGAPVLRGTGNTSKG